MKFAKKVSFLLTVLKSGTEWLKRRSKKKGRKNYIMDMHYQEKKKKFRIDLVDGTTAKILIDFLLNESKNKKSNVDVK